jgi:hypothetical protein
MRQTLLFLSVINDPPRIMNRQRGRTEALKCLQDRGRRNSEFFRGENPEQGAIEEELAGPFAPPDPVYAFWTILAALSVQLDPVGLGEILQVPVVIDVDQVDRWPCDKSRGRPTGMDSTLIYGERLRSGQFPEAAQNLIPEEQAQCGAGCCSQAGVSIELVWGAERAKASQHHRSAACDPQNVAGNPPIKPAAFLCESR